ncbi:MAG: GNAT family N-acetyltransferase [Pseudomonadota bacterium]
MNQPATASVSVSTSLADFDASAWDALNPTGFPFVSHAFLHALETTGCLGEAHGWYPHYLSVRDENGTLLAAAASYVKTNSYGEFVFDHAWADAWERAGGAYYPKLVVSCPYTPATGPRLLVHPEATDPAGLRQLLATALVQLSEKLKLSGTHVLFTSDADAAAFSNAGFVRRTDVQYHWRNRGFASFGDYLGALNARKRKNVRRERQQVEAQGIRLSWRDGGTLTLAEWQQVHALYAGIYERKWGVPSLSPAFFQCLGERMPHNSHVVFAYTEAQPETPVACAILFSGGGALYGRYWGCHAPFRSLHFEACYYQGIEHCIRKGLTLFEPGAQGEHKIARGFLPTYTHSWHRLNHDGFQSAVSDFLARETPAVERHHAMLTQSSPYRQSDNA